MCGKLPGSLLWVQMPNWPGYEEGMPRAVIGHPILRYRREPHRAERPWWVCIGRLKDDPADELWTCSRMVIKAVHEALDYERGWFDTYLSKADLAYDRPFVSRSLAEQLLCEAINNANMSKAKFNFTHYPNESAYLNGMVTERVFNLLVEEKVLRNPTAHDFRPVVKERVDERITKPVDRKKVWAVDRDAADLWVTTRLLLLEDNLRPLRF